MPYTLRRCGSHQYGTPLPSSDIDVVGELPANLDQFGLSRRESLQRVLERLRRGSRCTVVGVSIERKKTSEFCFA